MVNDPFLKVVTFGLPLVLAVVCHEVAHGWVANRLGDPTAAKMGRLTLNPWRHVDPLGTIVVPLALIVVGSQFIFGWAKPVPVNFLNLHNPRRDMVKVALAGPLTNLVLAVVSAAFAHALFALGFDLSSFTLSLAVASVLINLVLAVLNMMPVLPLDGGRVVAGLLPRGPAIAFARLERYGLLVVALLLFSGVLGKILGPVVGFLLMLLGFFA
jgi:Zn-dependent protease